MHPFSILTLGIFVAGYITARWDLVTRLYELAVFAADHGVVVSSTGFNLLLPLLFVLDQGPLLLTSRRLEPPEDSRLFLWSFSFSSCPLNALQHARQTM